MIRRGLCLLLLGVSLVVVASSSGAPTWSAAVQISVGDRALGPEFAVNARGDAIAVWDQEVGSDCGRDPASLGCVHIVMAATREAGSGWRQPIEVARPGVGAAPRVAIDDAGDAGILWIHDIGRDRVVQAAYRKGLDGTFSEPSDVSEASLEVRDHAVELDGAGDVVAAWAERTVPGVNSHYAVRVAVRPASTGGWAGPVTLASPKGNLFGGPSLAVTPSGLAALAWIQDGVPRASLGDVHLRSWGAPADLTGVPRHALGTPAVGMNTAGDVVVAWPADAASGLGSDVHVASWVRSRGSWELGARIGELHYSVDGPQAALDDTGRALIAWPSPRGLESAARSAETGSWSRPALVTASPDVDDPALAEDSRGNAVVLWTEGAGRAVQAAVRPAATGEWLPATRLSDDRAASPRAGLDALGTTFAVWMRFAGGTDAAPNFHVEGADLAGGGPVLDRLTVPKRAIARKSARFSVRAVPWSSPIAGLPLWKFGDGRSGRGNIVTHVYLRAGRYAVSVAVRDGAGGRTVATRTLIVVARR